MVAYIWPIALVVLSNLIYNICANSFPSGINPFAALTITYLVAAVASFAMYYSTKEERSGLLLEYAKANWVPYVFGLCLVGLESGYIFVYKAGWPISSAYIIIAAILSAFLILVGVFLYKEPISWNKILGIAICILGLWFIQK